MDWVLIDTKTVFARMADWLQPLKGDILMGGLSKSVEKRGGGCQQKKGYRTPMHTQRGQMHVHLLRLVHWDVCRLFSYIYKKITLFNKIAFYLKFLKYLKDVNECLRIFYQ